MKKPFHRRKIEDKERFEWFARWCAGDSTHEIGARFDRPPWTINQWIRQYLGIDYIDNKQRK